MLNSEIFDAYYQMTKDPEKISFATMMTDISDTIDQETIHTMQVDLDNYIKSMEYTKNSRELLVSV
jgi:hypothetical protein